jgi:hypothetical protein
MTTIFMVSPSLCNPGGKIVRGFPNQHKRRGGRLGSAEVSTLGYSRFGANAVGDGEPAIASEKKPRV